MSTNGSSSRPEDRDQVGLPPAANELLKDLQKNTPWFKGEIDVYRAAISVALAKGLSPRLEEADTGYVTKYNAHDLDEDGKLSLLISTLAPEHADAPYRWAQRLANKGVHYLHHEIVVKGRPIGEVLGVPLTEEQ